MKEYEHLKKYAIDSNSLVNLPNGDISKASVLSVHRKFNYRSFQYVTESTFNRRIGANLVRDYNFAVLLIIDQYNETCSKDDLIHPVVVENKSLNENRFLVPQKEVFLVERLMRQNFVLLNKFLYSKEAISNDPLEHYDNLRSLTKKYGLKSTVIKHLVYHLPIKKEELFYLKLSGLSTKEIADRTNMEKRSVLHELKDVLTGLEEIASKPRSQWPRATGVIALSKIFRDNKNLLYKYTEDLKPPYSTCAYWLYDLNLNEAEIMRMTNMSRGQTIRLITETRRKLVRIAIENERIDLLRVNLNGITY